MSTVKDWLSVSEPELVALTHKWEVYLPQGETQEKFGWDSDECNNMGILITTFMFASTAYETSNSSINRQAKNIAKKNVIAGMRRFANSFIRYNLKMNDTDRAAMGIQKRDTNPTVRPRPVTRPETVVENTKNRLEHKVLALSGESRKATKPEEAHGVRFAWQVGGDKPTGGEDLPKTKFTRRASLTVTYTEADKGKPVYYAACYENARGDAGPWSLLTSAYIN